MNPGPQLVGQQSAIAQKNAEWLIGPVSYLKQAKGLRTRGYEGSYSVKALYTYVSRFGSAVKEGRRLLW